MYVGADGSIADEGTETDLLQQYTDGGVGTSGAPFCAPWCSQVEAPRCCDLNGCFYRFQWPLRSTLAVSLGSQAPVGRDQHEAPFPQQRSRSCILPASMGVYYRG